MKLQLRKLLRLSSLSLITTLCTFSWSIAEAAHSREYYHAQYQRQQQQLKQQRQREYQQQQQAQYQPPQRSVEELNHILFRAAQLGRIDLMQRVLEDGAEATYRNHNGETPLHAAAAYGHMNAAQLLIQKGADTNARTVKNWTPLHNAARFGHARLASYLVYNGSKVNMWNSDGNTPRGLAEIAGFYTAADIVERLGGR